MLLAAVAYASLPPPPRPLARTAAPVVPLSLRVEPDGAFTLGIDGLPLLSGDEYRVGRLSSFDGSLVLLAPPARSVGWDVFGPYEAVSLSWTAGGHGALSSMPGELMRCTFRTYPWDAGQVVVEQFFPSGLDLASAALAPSADTPDAALPTSTLCPGFHRGPADPAANELRSISYHGLFPQPRTTPLGAYAHSHQGGSPLAVYNTSGFDSAETASADAPVLVFSQLSSPKAGHLAGAARFFGGGLKATAPIVPAGWRQLFLVSAGRGVNGGFMAWGDRMLAFSRKPRADMYRDVTHSSIGFWTDNGGYYHYSTGLDKSASYLEILPRVLAYHAALGVPFRHWQFDSWFYPKDGDVLPGGGGGAVTNWTSLGAVFPSSRPGGGMADIQSILRMPMVMHNRQWSSRSDYIRNLPFEWYTSECCAVPKDPAAFFDWFFKQQEGWGLTMYEQDWMNKEYDGVEALQYNLSLADQWLAGMAEGAQRSGRSVQYCMPYAHDLLSGAALSAVTNARATGDYHIGSSQWAVGGGAMLIWALGMLPFKDGFYSSTDIQPGGQNEGPELRPDREILMAVLSTAMVAPMDGIGHLNASRVLAACRADGFILKPDAPATPVDACFGRAAPELCHVYTTSSTVLGFGRVMYVFMDQPEPLTPALLGMRALYGAGEEAFKLWVGQPHGGPMPRTAPPAHVVYNWYTHALSLLHPGDDQPLGAGYEGHAYALVSPLIDGWAFLGQVDKYAPASRLRFPRVTIAGGRLIASIVGIQGELVRVCAAHVAPAPTALGVPITDKARLAAMQVGSYRDGMMMPMALDCALSLVCEDVQFAATGTLEVILEAPQPVAAAARRAVTFVTAGCMRFSNSRIMNETLRSP